MQFFMSCSTAEVEKDPFCRAVIRSRVEDNLVHAAPIAEDIRSYRATPGSAAGLLAGFPCQDSRLEMSLRSSFIEV